MEVGDSVVASVGDGVWVDVARTVGVPVAVGDTRVLVTVSGSAVSVAVRVNVGVPVAVGAIAV